MHCATIDVEAALRDKEAPDQVIPRDLEHKNAGSQTCDTSTEGSTSLASLPKQAHHYNWSSEGARAGKALGEVFAQKLGLHQAMTGTVDQGSKALARSEGACVQVSLSFFASLLCPCAGAASLPCHLPQAFYVHSGIVCTCILPSFVPCSLKRVFLEITVTCMQDGTEAVPFPALHPLVDPATLRINVALTAGC